MNKLHQRGTAELYDILAYAKKAGYRVRLGAQIIVFGADGDMIGQYGYTDLNKLRRDLEADLLRRCELWRPALDALGWHYVLHANAADQDIARDDQPKLVIADDSGLAVADYGFSAPEQEEMAEFINASFMLQYERHQQSHDVTPWKCVGTTVGNITIDADVAQRAYELGLTEKQFLKLLHAMLEKGQLQC